MVSIVYFGNQWSAEHRTSSHHIAARLARRWPVLYVETPGLRAPHANHRDVKKIARLLRAWVQPPQPAGEGIWRMSMPQLPFRRLRFVRFLNERSNLWRVRRALRSLRWTYPIFWFTIPHVTGIPFEKLGRLSVYYCVDDYSALPDVDAGQVHRLDQDLSKRVDLIFTVSRTLEEAKSKLNPSVYHSPHGVDVAHFAKAEHRTKSVAEPVRGLAHPIIGFLGVLDARIDVELLRDLAAAKPEWTVLIVGRVATDANEIARMRNIVLAGPVPYDQLPDWVQAFDVCVMPYRAGAFAQSSNPLKLREYLATGKPVVSSALPEVAQFAPHVRLASDATGFIHQIEQALRENPECASARRQSVSDMSWDARVNTIIHIVEQQLAEKEASRSQPICESYS